jgi:hypothetical protein
MTQAHQQLTRAVQTLAVGRGPIRERLIAACGYLELPDARDWPPQFLAEAQALHARVTCFHGPDGSIATTIGGMDDTELFEIATRILALEHELRNL